MRLSLTNLLLLWVVSCAFFVSTSASQVVDVAYDQYGFMETAPLCFRSDIPSNPGSLGVPELRACLPFRGGW
eukprot:482919-Prorocentrum_minimum.AAC.1